MFTPGDHLNVFELDGIKMASITCYDIRFGEWVRMAALAGAQILFVPAAWAEQRRQHWLILNQARAIENQFYVVAVNSCGTTDTVRFGGSSLIADPGRSRRNDPPGRCGFFHYGTNSPKDQRLP